MTRFPSGFLARLKEAAGSVLGAEAGTRCFVAPGRVNLIGEHTDYNDGYVLPAALELGLVVLVAARTGREATVVSTDIAPPDRFSVDEPTRLGGDAWSNYVRGVVAALRAAGAEIGGFAMVVGSTIPVGAGLSSSAAIEVGVGYALARVFGFDVPRRDLALMCQRVENSFIGVNCGIMDQFVVANAREGHALFLDCRSLEAEAVPLASEGIAIMVCDTSHPRALAGSKYNERRAECEEAVSLLARAHPEIAALRDAGPELLPELKSVASDVVYRRARHVISENQRVLDSVACLKRGDLPAFGALMDDSHESLRVDYEVSCVQLDAMVGIARSLDGVLGARMTGAGFGGCAVGLVEEGVATEVEREIGARYPHGTGLPARIYRSRACEGVAEVSVEELFGVSSPGVRA